MYIENIKDTGNPGDKLDNVFIVWCTKIPESKRLIIVGFYKDSIVHRTVNILSYDFPIAEREKISG